MKKITLVVLILFTSLGYAQAGMNTNTPDASSALEIESTTGGILIPRLTETQRDDISAPAKGLMIYQINGTSGFYFWDGAAWTKIDGVAGPQGDTGAVGQTGPQGEAGAQGPQGPGGSSGPGGSNGFSAYELAIIGGEFAGTVTEWFLHIKGDQGPQGDQGIQGIDGASYTQSTCLNNTFYAELGGYVIEVNSDGTHGLVVAKKENTLSNWYQTNDLLIDAGNYDSHGAKFKDWRLPTKRESNLMYISHSNPNGTNAVTYNNLERFFWSSSENAEGVPGRVWIQYFSTGNQYSQTNKFNPNNVRAVRDF